MTGNNLINLIRTEVEEFLYKRNQVEIIEEDGDDSPIYLWEANADTDSLEVLINGTPTTQYSLSELALTFLSGVTLVEGDVVHLKYNYYPNYSSSIIKKYILSALQKIKLYYPKTLETETNPTTGDFIIRDIDTSGNPEISESMYAMVGDITVVLIKPDWRAYRGIELNINYRGSMSKREIIKRIIDDFKQDKVGQFDTLETEEES